jgi:hypothetical protein
MIDWEIAATIGATAMRQIISFNQQQDEHVWLWAYVQIARDADDESYLLKIAAVLWADWPG